MSISCCKLRLISSPLISLLEQAEADAKPPQANNKTQCQIDAEAIKKPDELRNCPPGAGPVGDLKPRVVQVTLRGRHLFLLPKSTTDPDSLVKEAAHFDKAITSWEGWGTFETLTSMCGRFVVQYDKTDVDEAGTPRAVIGVTEKIVSCDTYKEGEDDSSSSSSDDTETEDGNEEKWPVQPRAQMGTPEPQMRKRRRVASPSSPAALPAKKACLGSSFPYDTASDTESDSDDEPPGWLGNESGKSEADDKKQPGSQSDPVKILNTRVTFGQIDLIPSDEYKAMYESGNSLPRPRDYLIFGQSVPEMGD